MKLAQSYGHVKSVWERDVRRRCLFLSLAGEVQWLFPRYLRDRFPQCQVFLALQVVSSERVHPQLPVVNKMLDKSLDTLVNIQKAIENCHWKSEFSHSKHSGSVDLSSSLCKFVYQRLIYNWTWLHWDKMVILKTPPEIIAMAKQGEIVGLSMRFFQQQWLSEGNCPLISRCYPFIFHHYPTIIIPLLQPLILSHCYPIVIPLLSHCCAIVIPLLQPLISHDYIRYEWILRWFTLW